MGEKDKPVSCAFLTTDTTQMCITRGMLNPKQNRLWDTHTPSAAVSKDRCQITHIHFLYHHQQATHKPFSGYKATVTIHNVLNPGLQSAWSEFNKNHCYQLHTDLAQAWQHSSVQDVNTVVACVQIHTLPILFCSETRKSSQHITGQYYSRP